MLLLDQLLDMGFSKEISEKAIRSCPHNNLESAIEWIVENQESTQLTTDEQLPDQKEGAIRSKSFKCEDCGKLLRNDDEVQLHSTRTGHVNYAESTDEIKQLTEEEKNQQMEKLQESLRQKKIQRDREEREREVEMEKKRREQGKSIGLAKSVYEQEEVRRMVEERRRQKIEDIQLRESLRKMIAEDREKQKIRDQGFVADPPQPKPNQVDNPTPRPTLADPSTCRAQLRFPNASTKRSELQPSDKLDVILQDAVDHWPAELGEVSANDIKLFTTFPKREFSGDDMSKTLFELGLCPSIVIMVKRNTPI